MIYLGGNNLEMINIAVKKKLSADEREFLSQEFFNFAAEYQASVNKAAKQVAQNQGAKSSKKIGLLK